MLIIRNPNTDPYFNLAAEEYLLKNFDEDIFTLWRNENAIIVGKHQNTLSEINIDHVTEKNVKVIRRLSGGGAVFHDLGNLNFTFISNAREKEDVKIDFRYYTQPILDVLISLGLNASFSGRNDLLIDEMKISGNAEHIYQQKKRTLHHGTLLFASRIADLSAALKVNPLKFIDKSVKSVRSRVTNISEHLKQAMDVNEFYDLIINHISEVNKDFTFYSYSDDDINAIQKLADEKYKTWEWNFGYSPKYNFSKTFRSTGGNIETSMYVEKGLIEKIKFQGDFFNENDIEELENALLKCRHEKSAIKEILSGFEIGRYFNNTSEEELLNGMF